LPSRIPPGRHAPPLGVRDELHLVTREDEELRTLLHDRGEVPEPHHVGWVGHGRVVEEVEQLLDVR